MMPRELTAENGAKELLLGEFWETAPAACPECFGGADGDGEDDQCPNCNGTGEVSQDVPVNWTTIKAIYAKAVQHLGT